MIRADRELLSQLSAVNQTMGEIVLRLLSDSFGAGELPADKLRGVATGLTSLADDLSMVATAMQRRADEIDPVPADSSTGPPDPAARTAEGAHRC